jgi:hypothetical protein
MTKNKPIPKKKLGKQPIEDRSTASADERDAELLKRAFLISDIVEIKSLILTECCASRSSDLPEGGKRKGELKVTNVSYVLAEEDRDLQVQIEFGLTMKAGGSADQKLEVKATFAINYSMKSSAEFAESEYQAFAELNGVHNAWPFWRELVLNLTSRMGISPIVIPVHRVG